MGCWLYGRQIKSVESVSLAWTIYWKHKGPVAMDQPFQPLLPDEEMPKRGAVGQSAHNHPFQKLLLDTHGYSHGKLVL